MIKNVLFFIFLVMISSLSYSQVYNFNYYDSMTVVDEENIWKEGAMDTSFEFFPSGEEKVKIIMGSQKTLYFHILSFEGAGIRENVKYDQKINLRSESSGNLATLIIMNGLISSIELIDVNSGYRIWFKNSVTVNN